MKNVILGVFGGILTLYMVVISLCLYGIQTRKNEVENMLSQVVEGVLTAHYVPEPLRTPQTETLSQEAVKKEVEEEIRMRISSDTQTGVSVLACDLDKGILSVQVTGSFELPGGFHKTFLFSKTAIMDRQAEEEPLSCIRFQVDGGDYKVFTLRPGEKYPVPKEPEGTFLGWQAAQGNSHAAWESNMTVQGDETWIAKRR